MMQFTPLVWPMAIVFIALVFRRDLGQAMGRIGRVKYRDLELVFRENLHQAEQLAMSIPPSDKGSVVLQSSVDAGKPLVGRLIVAPSISGTPIERPDSPADLAGHRPREAVEAAWGILDRALTGTSKQKRPAALADRNVVELVGLLRTLKDRAARTEQPPPTPEDARRFVDLAMGVAARIEELG